MHAIQSLAALLISALVVAPLARAQNGAALTVNSIGVSGSGSDDFHYYGQLDGIAAYSFATSACSSGTSGVSWTSANHPVIGQNLFRYKDGRFEQLGQSWLVHAACVPVFIQDCAGCPDTNCQVLDPGCASRQFATFNDPSTGGPKWQVDVAAGTNIPNHPGPTGQQPIVGRLQVPVVDMEPLENPGADYYCEAQYVSASVCQDQNGSQGNGWRRVNVIGVDNLQGGGPTHPGEPGVFAWRDRDPAVEIRIADSGEAAGQGRFYVASRATGTGPWTYTFCVQNVSSQRAAYAFDIPVPQSATLSDVYFHDVDHHSGEPYDNTDWEWQHSGGLLRFHSTQTFLQDADANALRWGTMYTFQFTADAPPEPGLAELVMFEEGPGALSVAVEVSHPSGVPAAVGTAFCAGDGSGPLCGCLNLGAPGRGCQNSDFLEGCELRASGAASVANDTVVLQADLASSGAPGLLFAGDEDQNGGAGFPFGDGLRCAGGDVVRLEILFSGLGALASSTVPIGAASGASAGDRVFYQYWYRDPAGSPCGSGFNLSNGLILDWTN